MRPNSRETKRLLGLRFRDSLAAWIQANAKDSGRTMTAVVREALEDARSMYGLPLPVVELLEEDAAALGLDRRRYAQHVLFRRFEQVKRHEPLFDLPQVPERPRLTQSNTYVYHAVRSGEQRDGHDRS
jgi:hypothetical protein